MEVYDVHKRKHPEGPENTVTRCVGVHTTLMKYHLREREGLTQLQCTRQASAPSNV